MPYTLKTGRIKVKDPVSGEYGQFDVSAEPVVDSALSNSSTNPVQNRVVNNALSGLSDAVDDLSDEIAGKVAKTNAVIESSVSMGRTENSYVGDFSVALGSGVIASGPVSSAFGANCSATNIGAHAEGVANTASGQYSHAEGLLNTSSGTFAHSEGNSNTAEGHNSHVEGYGNIAHGAYSHVHGMYAITDPGTISPNAKGNWVTIVGNGTSDSYRSNAHTLHWSGRAEYAGDVLANACGGENPVSLVTVASSLTDKMDKIDLQLIENYSYNFETETSFERRLTPSGDPYDFEFIDIEVVVNPGGTVGNYGVITYYDETSDPQSMFECSRTNASEYRSHFGGFMLPVGGNLFLPIHYVSTNTGNPNTLAAKSHWTGNNTITHFREIKKWKGLRIDAMTGTGEIRIWAGNRR